MERNAAMLRKVGDHIASEPDRYNQSVWAQLDTSNEKHKGSVMIDGVTTPTINIECTSTCCVAGTAAYFSPDVVSWIATDSYRPHADYALTAEGEIKLIMDVGREALGLDEEDARTLFSESWRPVGEGTLHENVRDALYALADGADIYDVTLGETDEEVDEDD